MPLKRLDASVVSMVVLLLLAVAGWATLRATGTEPADRKTQRERFLSLSAEEQARLLRLHDEFQSLPAERQAELRKLHGAVEKDLRQDGELDELLTTYVNWLGTLSPGQRDDLRKETDPDRRAKLVATLERQKANDPAPVSAAAPSPNLMSGGPPGGGPMLALSSADLAAVMKLWEASVAQSETLTPEQQKQLSGLSGVGRYVRLLEILLRSEKEPGRPPFSGMTPTLLEALTQSITNPTHSELLASKTDRIERATTFFRMVSGGIFAEFERNKPTDKQLEPYFTKLSGAERDHFMAMSPDAMRRALTRKFAEDHPELYPRGGELWEVMQRMSWMDRSKFSRDPRRENNFRKPGSMLPGTGSGTGGTPGGMPGRPFFPERGFGERPFSGPGGNGSPGSGTGTGPERPPDRPNGPRPMGTDRGSGAPAAGSGDRPGPNSDRVRPPLPRPATNRPMPST